MIRIATVDAPFNRSALLGPTIGLVRRAVALGLLRDRAEIDRLNLELVRGIAREASSAGVGHDVALELLGSPKPGQLAGLIGRLDDALLASPLPERELAQLAGVFDYDQLAELVGASAVSLRRYASGARSVPDVIAARLHWLALVTSDLAGAYNAPGIRRWFERPRSQLGSRSPRAALGAAWDPDDEQVERVRRLAAALAGPGDAT